jgi:hypothetical protein
MTQARPGERGVALTAVALFMVVILGFVALGIDVARLAHTATEVQTVADAAARAGAKALYDADGAANAGITRAKLIGNDNPMNGGPAPVADVVVDEGHYDADAERFECCTSNTPCCANGQWGSLDCAASSSCAKRTAVLVTPQTDVDNLFAGILDFFDNGRLANAAVTSGHAISTIEKVAIAGASGPGAGCQAPPGCAANDWACFCNAGVAPCLPIAAPSCAFPKPCLENCQLPSLTMGGPQTDTANWHGFQEGHNTNTVRGFLRHTQCPGSGSYTPPGDQSVFGSGAWVDVTNGVTGSGTGNPFNMAQCIWQKNLGCAINGDGEITGSGGTVFTIPIYDASNCSVPASGHQDLVGFATVRITNVVVQGNTRRIDLQTLARSTPEAVSSGGGCFGTDCRVVLAK